MFYDWTKQPDGSYQRSVEDGSTCIIKPTNNSIQEELGQRFEVMIESEKVPLEVRDRQVPMFAQVPLGYASDLESAKRLITENTKIVWAKSPFQMFAFKLGAFTANMLWRFLPIFIGFQYFALRFPEVKERLIAFDLFAVLLLIGFDRAYMTRLLENERKESGKK